MAAVRILHLVGRSHHRGAERVARELAEELDALGHANRLCALSLGHEGGRVPDLPPLVHGVRQGPRQLLVGAWRLRRVLRDDPVDVVLAHGAAAALVAVMASPRRGPALVWQRILGLADRSFRGVLGLTWRVAVRRVDGVVALTAELGDEVRRLGYSGPVWSIPNGRRRGRFLDLDHEEEAARLRATLGVGADVGLIGLVGFLVDQKRPQLAVDVLARVRQEGVDAHLVVVGAGPRRHAVVREAADRGVDGHMSLLGHRDDVPEILAALDLVILTSAEEGVPGVVIEAAMAGCPVVTFPSGGGGDVVVDQVTGLVLAEASTAAMADAVAALLSDGDRRRAMAQAAAAGSGSYSLESLAVRYQTHLAEVVSAGRGALGAGGTADGGESTTVGSR